MTSDIASIHAPRNSLERAPCRISFREYYSARHITSLHPKAPPGARLLAIILGEGASQDGCLYSGLGDAIGLVQFTDAQGKRAIEWLVKHGLLLYAEREDTWCLCRDLDGNEISVVDGFLRGSPDHDCSPFRRVV